MNKLTVILHRPNSVVDTYIAQVTSDNVREAIHMARDEASSKDGTHYDYKLVAVLGGWPDVHLYGWQE